jgi:hypothetical protein
MRLIALIEQAAVVTRILRHLSLPDEIPPPAPSRAPPNPFGARGADDHDAGRRTEPEWLASC